MHSRPRHRAVKYAYFHRVPTISTTIQVNIELNKTTTTPSPLPLQGSFKVVTELFDKVFGFFEEIVADGLAVECFVAAIDDGEVVVNFVFGDV